MYGPTTVEELSKLRHDKVTMVNDLDVRESENRVSGDLELHITLPVAGKPLRIAMFLAVDLDNAPLGAPEEIDADRIGQRMRLKLLIPFAPGCPVHARQSGLQGLLGPAGRMRPPGDRGIADHGGRSVGRGFGLAGCRSADGWWPELDTHHIVD